MNSSRPEGVSEKDLSLQGQIESVMKRFEAEGRWECIFLFSPEGLPMATSGTSDLYREENLLEFAFSLISTMKMLGGKPPVKDVWIRVQDRKSLVFRYFDAWGEPLILAAVVSGRKGYRHALNKLVKQIQNASE